MSTIEGDNLVWAWNGNTPETNSTNVVLLDKGGSNGAEGENPYFCRFSTV